MGIRRAEANSLTQLGNMALVQDDVSGAEEFYRKGIYISQDISAASITMEILIGWADILSRKRLDQEAWQILSFLSAELPNYADRLAMANRVKQRITTRVPISTLELIEAQDQELTLESLVKKLKADTVQ